MIVEWNDRGKQEACTLIRGRLALRCAGMEDGIVRGNRSIGLVRTEGSRGG
ncbi:hypothetical protein NPIL_258211, partial [Nephila pilipes]